MKRLPFGHQLNKLYPIEWISVGLLSLWVSVQLAALIYRNLVRREGIGWKPGDSQVPAAALIGLAISALVLVSTFLLLIAGWFFLKAARRRQAKQSHQIALCLSVCTFVASGIYISMIDSTGSPSTSYFGPAAIWLAMIASFLIQSRKDSAENASL